MAEQRQVFVVKRTEEGESELSIASIWTTLESANAEARSFFDEVDGKSKEKKQRDGALEITAGDIKAVVESWELQGATATSNPEKSETKKPTAVSKKPAAEKTKAVPKPSKSSGPTVDTPKGAEDALAGRNIVVTGSIEGYTRTQIQTVIQNHGGKASSSISKNVDLVVLGDNAGPKKLLQIEELGIETVTYEELTEMIESAPPGEKRGAGDNGEERKSKRGKNA